MPLTARSTPATSTRASTPLDFDRPLLTSAVFVGLVALAASSRLINIAPNVAAVAAAGLLAGALFRSRTLAVCVPICAMLLSDVSIGSYAPLVMAAVYTGLTLPALVGRWLHVRSGPARLLATAVGCSTAFFLLTNLAVWFSGTGVGAPRSLDGLIACYAAAVPFYRLTLMGDVAFTLTLFGAWALLSHAITARRGLAA